MLLGWHPPAVVGESEFVNIGAEKDYATGGTQYPPEAGFNDVTVSVSWAVAQPKGSAG